MKVFCRGFNIFSQLNNSHPLLDQFIQTFQDITFDGLAINHTYAVSKKEYILSFYSSALKDLYKLSSLDLFKTIGNANVIKISSDDEKILLLTDTGQLYKLMIDDAHTVQRIPKFWDSNDKIISVVSGIKLNLAYSEKGCLFNIPNKLDVNIDLADIKLGKEHCMILDKTGNIYTFGSGSRGQLGHGNLDNLSEPQLVEGLAGIKMLRIAAGGWHSCALSETGDLYTWGWNGNGQLGFGSKKVVSVMALPNLIDLFENEERNVMNVACGHRHTIVLLDDGILYGCGWNKYKQLNNEKNESYNSFVKLHDFSNEVVLDILCGSWNTCVFCK